MVLLSKDKEELKIWQKEINKFLQEKLKLKLHSKKQVLQNIDKGINFVGYVVRPNYTLVRRRAVKNLKEKLWNFNQNFEKLEKPEIKNILSVVNSYYGQFKRADGFGLRRKTWQKNFNKLQTVLKPIDKNFSYFQIIK